MDLGAAREVMVFRALQLGDLLCSVPALRALREAAPAARITLVGLPWARGFVARFAHLLDDFVEFPGWPGLPERDCDLSAIPGFLQRLQAARFDWALQLHGSGPVVNELVALSGARRLAGFRLPGHWCPDPAGFIEWPEHLHEIRRWTALTDHLGAPTADTRLEFPVAPAEWAEAEALLPDAGAAFAVVHPGSQLPSRRWPPARFARVADHLARRGLQVVFTGTAQEAPVVDAVRAAMQAPSTDLCGRSSLGALAALVARARLLVANDTGPGHLAVAAGTPSAIVSCGADIARWAPLDADRHRVAWHAVPCRPCGFRDCPVDGHPCATGVEATELVDIVDDLLDTPSGRHGRLACAA